MKRKRDRAKYEQKKRQTRLAILKDARQAVKENVKSRRAERLIRFAPLDNCMNVCDSLLRQRMLPKWFRVQALSTGLCD